MILTALAELARDEGLVKNPDYQPLPVRWLITVGPDGRFRGGFRDMLTPPSDAKGKPTAVRYDIPKRSSRTTQNLAEFIVDKPEYVLGGLSPDDLKGVDLAKVEKLRKRAADRHAIYKAELTVAATASGDEGLASLVRALDGTLPPLPDDLGSADLIGFVDADGAPIWSRPKVVEYWAARRRQAECGTGRSGTTVTTPENSGLPCLVTGMVALPVKLHPRPKGIPPVAKTKGGVPLTSVNADAFDSYGLGRVGGAAVSQEAADAYEKALNRLLADGNYPDPFDGSPMPRRNVRLTDDTVVVFWSKGDPAAVNLFADTVGLGEPSAVNDLLHSPWKGGKVDLHDPSAFYALTLSGAQGRATVRGWQEERLGDVLRHVLQYFDDIEIAGRDLDRPRPLLGLLRQVAAQGKSENIPSGLAADIFAAILAGKEFPRSLLDAAVRRVRADRTLYTERAALIKAYLIRAGVLQILDANRHPTPEERFVMLNEDCHEPSYVLGRLFAALELIQEKAVKPKRTIRDSFYGAASATPRLVFPLLDRKSKNHLSKLREEPETKGLAVKFDKLLGRINWLFTVPDPYPATLSVAEQGLFAIGYYHQRQAWFTATPENNTPTPEPEQES